MGIKHRSLKLHSSFSTKQLFCLLLLISFLKRFTQESSILHNSMKRLTRHSGCLQFNNFHSHLTTVGFVAFFSSPIQIMTWYSEATWQMGNHLQLHTICLNIYIHICKHIPCKMTAHSFPWIKIFNVLISSWMHAIMNVNIPSCRIPVSIHP